MKLPQKFTVQAKGSHPVSQPYEMEIRATGHYLIIDGTKLSWNDARTAFEIFTSYDKHRKALFGD